MKRCVLLLLLPFQLFAQEAQLENYVDSILGPINKPAVPGTMILIAQDGKPILKKAYGMANLELKVPLTTDHSFATGSVGKQFTAIAILQLAQQGKLKLSDDIRKHLPGYNSHGHLITIEHLITHTSGISSTERNDMSQFIEENGVSFHPNAFIPYVMKANLLFDPGTNWSYNNIAFMLAAIIVEKISGQKFGDYLFEHIFQPAGMRNTYLANDLNPLNNVAVSYVREYDGKWRNVNRQNNWGWEKGAGGIISTLEDMLQWDIALRENKVLPQEILEKAWKPFQLKNGSSANYGYGWHIKSSGEYRIISHGGAVNAYRAQSVHIPEKKLYLFYVNFYGADYNTIPKKIVRRLLNIAAQVTVKATVENMADYTGAYLMNYAGSRIRQQVTAQPQYAIFTTSGDSLFMRQPFGEKTFLRPAGNDRFLLPGSENNIYVFNRGADGKVKSMTIEAFLFGGAATNVENKKVIIGKKSAEKVVSVSEEILMKYTGTYYNALEDRYMFILMEGSNLFAHQVNAAPKFELLPISNNKFIRKGVEEYTISFKENSNGLMILTASIFNTVDYRKIAD